MTLDEYKAWLDGFSSSINGVPTIEQWNKIKDKLNQVFISNTENYPYIPYSPQPWIAPYSKNPFRNGEIIC